MGEEGSRLHHAMNKIPTIFERDWDGDRSRVLDKPAAGCDWVFAGEGTATRKLDGTCCRIRNGKLYKRHEVRPNRTAPDGFEPVATDDETGKTVGWVPVGDGPEDRWHREAFQLAFKDELVDGTYELIGPKVQGNPERGLDHVLVPHTVAKLALADPPERTYPAIRDWLAAHDMEGIVFHHPDGRMAKIKPATSGSNEATSGRDATLRASNRMPPRAA